MNKRRIPKLVIVPYEITREKLFNRDFIKCRDCNSNLMYIEIQYGIVKEEEWYGIMGNKSNRTYNVRETGFCLYCAECGEFVENYCKFYHDDEIVYQLEGNTDEDEMVEINYCLHQFNQKRDFTPQYKFAELNIIKEKLKEFELKYPEKAEKSDKTQKLLKVKEAEAKAKEK